MKTGKLTSISVLQSNDDAVLAPYLAVRDRLMPLPSPTGKFSTIAAGIIAALIVPSLIVIDTGRMHVAYALGTDALSAGVTGFMEGLEGIERRFTPGDETKTSSSLVVKTEAGVIVSAAIVPPQNQTALDAEIDAAIGASLGSASISSVSDAAADAAEAAGKECFIVLDQKAKTARAYFVDSTAASDTILEIINGVTANSVLQVIGLEIPQTTGSAPAGWYRA